MKKIRKIALIMVIAVVAAHAAACGAETTDNKETESVPVHVIEDYSVDAEDHSEASAGQAEETVTIKADALGAPLSATLKKSGEDMEENADIADLPFNVKVSYYLDGSEVTPEELAGASGRLRIRFDYENTSDSVIKMNEQELHTIVPLGFITMVSMPEERFSNIEVSGGGITNMAGTNIAFGYAMPGVQQALGVDGVKEKIKSVAETVDDEDSESGDDKDKELFPDHFEITANTENCKIEFTATIVTNGLLQDVEDSDLDDLDELIGRFGKFGEAGDELNDGVNELGEGAWALWEGLEGYVDGVSALSSGASQLSAGASALSSQNAALSEGAMQLSSGLSQLQTALAAVPGMEDLKGQIAALASGAEALKGGIDSYTAGVSQISSGAAQLANGAGELAAAGGELKSSYWQLLEGIAELKDGVAEMNDKMFQNIASLSEGELPEMATNLRALQKADKGFTAWNTYDGTEGSIRFILETEGIS